MQGFGELEAAMMSALWDHDEPVSARKVLSDLQPQLAYNTMLTFIDKLYKKDQLKRARDGRAIRYWPAHSRADYGMQLMRNAMAESGDPAGSLFNVVQHLSDHAHCRHGERGRIGTHVSWPGTAERFCMAE